jgi:hypothetical protein
VARIGEEFRRQPRLHRVIEDARRHVRQSGPFRFAPVGRQRALEVEGRVVPDQVQVQVVAATRV